MRSAPQSPANVRPGVRIGVDVGTVRVGVARSDFHGILASPVSTIERGEGDLAELVRIVTELEAIEIIVGLPIALSGRTTASTDDALGFTEALARVSPVPVRLVDERLSTVSAAAQLRASGKNSKSSRFVIDQVAAVIILQHALDFERSGDIAPGTIAHPDKGPENG
jgi:putative Holliday junction resolvase